MLPFTLVVCYAAVICLVPVTFYLLWLGLLNRRGRPSVLAGGWDFAALLAGLSGFILFGGGVLLTLFQSGARFVLRGKTDTARDLFAQEYLAWSLTVAAYLVVVIGGCLLALAGRRRSVVVYNVDPGQFEATLGEILDHLGRHVERRGNLWTSGVPLFELDPFPGGRTVTLRWVSEDARLFQDVERQVREGVRTLPGGEHAAGRWLAFATTSCITVVVACTVFLVYAHTVMR